jgi:hypothetical protein
MYWDNGGVKSHKKMNKNQIQIKLYEIENALIKNTKERQKLINDKNNLEKMLSSGEYDK